MLLACLDLIVDFGPLLWAYTVSEIETKTGLLLKCLDSVADPWRFENWRQEILCSAEHVFWRSLDWNKASDAKQEYFKNICGWYQLAGHRSQFHATPLGSKCVCIQLGLISSTQLSRKTGRAMDHWQAEFILQPGKLSWRVTKNKPFGQSLLKS